MPSEDVHGFIRTIIRVNDRIADERLDPIVGHDPTVERVGAQFHIGKTKVSVAISFDPYLMPPPPDEDAL